MTHRISSLLLTTAMTLPIAGAAFAQDFVQPADATCDDLVAVVDLDYAGASLTRDDIVAIVESEDDAQCRVAYSEVYTFVATAEASDDAQLVESEETIVRLEDEVAIEGMVFLDVPAPAVDVRGGDTQVDVTDEAPEITINEAQADILIRQSAPTIRVDMPQPTITVSTPAPEIVVTMPAPGVDVANFRPTVEVLQGDPTVTVTQASPNVDLELRRAVDADSSQGIQVADRATGEAYAAGEVATVEADVTALNASPVVNYTDVDEAEVQERLVINRAEPVIRFESADPIVEMGEPMQPNVVFETVGEPMVSFEEAAVDMDADMDMAEADAMVEETDVEADAGLEVVEADETVAPAMEADPMVGTGFERDGYTAATMDDLTTEDLTGTRVYGANDEDIGEVGELLLADGEISQVVIDFGGFIGIGEKEVALDMSQMTILRSDDLGDFRVYVDLTEEELDAMPEYDG